MSRPLSERGRQACAQIGAYLRSKRYTPQLVMISPSLRTRETLQYVLEAAGATFSWKTYDGLYLASSEEILQVIHGVSDEIDELMLVGHNPGMHHLAWSLAISEDTSPIYTALEIKYPTGSLAKLTFECESWHDVRLHQGKLSDFVTPEQLPAL